MWSNLPQMTTQGGRVLIMVNWSAAMTTEAVGLQIRYLRSPLWSNRHRCTTCLRSTQPSTAMPNIPESFFASSCIPTPNLRTFLSSKISLTVCGRWFPILHKRIRKQSQRGVAIWSKATGALFWPFLFTHSQSSPTKFILKGYCARYDCSRLSQDETLSSTKIRDIFGLLSVTLADGKMMWEGLHRRWTGPKKRMPRNHCKNLKIETTVE